MKMNKKLESTCYECRKDICFNIKTREDFHVYIQRGVFDCYGRALMVPYYIEDFTMLMTIFLKGNVDELNIVNALRECVSSDPVIQMNEDRTIRFSCVNPANPDRLVIVEFKAHPFDIIQWCADYYKNPPL